jgi:long-chain acyl-CoA synthetase
MPTKDLPWHKEYKIFGTPRTLKPYPDKPVYQILLDTARDCKNVGLVQMNYQMTYPQVKDHVERLATALVNLGFKKGDRIATLLPTSIQFVIADYAISMAGLVHIPSSSLEPEKTLIHKFTEGSPKAIITLDEHIDIVSNVAKKLKIKTIIATELNDYSNNPPAEHKKLKTGGVLWMKDLILSTLPNPPSYVYNVEKDIETLLFTGGTTGVPKGCMLTHRNIYANSIQNSVVLGHTKVMLRGVASILLGLPFFHSYGHVVMHTFTMLGQNQLLVPDPRDAEGMISMIKQYKPIVQVGVPTQFMMLASDALKDSGMIGVSGSAPLPPKTVKEFQSKAGGGLMEGYGLSEMSPTTHINNSLMIRLLGGRTLTIITTRLLSIPGLARFVNIILRMLGSERSANIISRFMRRKMKSTGQNKTASKAEKIGTTGIPLPDTEVKLIDVNTGRPLSWEEVLAGKTGEMCLRGPQRMLGYWPDEGSGIDEEGYVHTSDVVKVDERGYFYIVDRTKDMIIVSGYKVYSREVDDILYEKHEVEVAATIGIPDPNREGSERVVVFIQPRPEFRKKLKPDAIIQYLKTRVAKYSIPKVVKIVDKIPLTEMQKVNKKLLREMAMKDPEIMKKADS